MKEDSIFKERFFAQYWGQRIGHYLKNPKGDLWVIKEDFTIKIEDFCLLLTPLSAITDEHAIEVGKIRYNDMCSVPIYELAELARHTEVSDFLRSKGYALPFGGKSVEQLIEMGILKLREI